MVPAYKGDVLTLRDTQVPPDGGILVGWTRSNTADATPGDASNQPDWTIVPGKSMTHLKLNRTSLAPGLSMYRPAIQGYPGMLTLVGNKGAALGTFTFDPKAKASSMAAPIALSVVLSETRESYRGTDHEVLATFKTAAPNDAVAVIVYKTFAKRSGKPAAAPIPLSFVRLPDTHDQLTELHVFDDAGHCGVLQPGSRPPAAHEKVAFAWVDAFGRRSPLSESVVAQSSTAKPAP
jgi:hypothetical protein